MKLRIAVYVAVGLLIALPRPAASQPYQFAKILDGSTQRPDGLGRFYLSLASTTPSFDGRWVVFRDPGPQNDDGSHAAIWSFDTRDQTFHKLVDFNTPVPGGGATFHDLQLTSAAPIVRNGTVVFLAYDSTAQQGLYSMPAAGGPITKIADRSTPDPTGGTFTVFDGSTAFSSPGKQMGAFSFDGVTIAFNASGTAMIPGNYSVKPDGSSLGVVADSPAMGGKIIAYYAPALANHNVVLFGTNGFPLPNGNQFYAGIYLGTVGGNSAVKELMNSGQPLPGNPNSNSHIRFDWPVLASDGTLVAFHATDANSGSLLNPAGLFGLYTVDLTSHAVTRIADSNSTLPGLPGKLAAIATSGVAVNRGSVLFRAADSTGASGLYIWKSGAVARIAGRGDLLDGATVQAVNEPGPAALSGSGFAFVVDFGGVNQALYLATPASNTPALAAVANSAGNLVVPAIAPGEIVTIWGANMGPAALTVAGANPNWPTLLSGVQVLFNDIAAPLIHVSEKQHAAIVPFGLAGASSAQIVVKYNNVSSNAITVPVANTVPGVFSADMTGSGGGAILNPDSSYNSSANPAAPGTIIALFLTGLGALNPVHADGAVVSDWTATTLQYRPSVTIGGQPATIAYQGPAPLEVAGLYQINCVIPPGTPSGPAEVVVTADSRQSQPNLTVAVQ
jgi:uncharacterized protein (TIGR03437 family)